MKQSADALKEGRYKTFSNADQLLEFLREENNADDNYRLPSENSPGKPWVLWSLIQNIIHLRFTGSKVQGFGRLMLTKILGLFLSKTATR